MPKSKDAFRTISEVADWLDVQPHVLRFWESKFSQVRPVKRAGGRRYYRPSDMQLIGGIKQLLHDDGMTIKGVQKLLREKGVKEISALSRPIDGDDNTVEMQDPAPVSEAELIADVISESAQTPEQDPAAIEPIKDDTVAESVAVSEETPQPQTDSVSTTEQEPVAVAETVEENSLPDPEPAEQVAAEPTSTPTLAAKPKKPLADYAPGWEIRRKIIARLTEISELEPEHRPEIAKAVAALAKLQANRRAPSALT